MTAEQATEARKALVLLADALALLESPRSWTRKGYALDGRGCQVSVEDPRARRFCTVGAVLRAEHERAATPMQVATDPRPEVEDLLLPVAPDAPPHVSLALRVLGVAALEELLAHGLAVSRPTEQELSLKHLPMLLSLRRDIGHSRAVSMLVRAVARAAQMAIADAPDQSGQAGAE